MDRIILHCDLNCFYANVEMLYHPEIRHLPVAVGGDVEKRHGIILTKNSLAKSYGIKTGEALWEARSKCPELIIFPPDFRKYLKFSQLVRDIFSDYTNLIEPFGIDEAWLDITDSYHLFGTPYRVAFMIKERIKNELGITASIGVSYNKVLAKLGSDYRKPDAITLINRHNKATIVDPLPVEDLLFVGRQTQKKLNLYNVFTIGQLAACEVGWLKQLFGKNGLMLWSYANGEDQSPVMLGGDHHPVKSVGNSSTTVCDMITHQDVYLVLHVLTQSVAARLREQGLKGRCLSLYLRDNLLSGISCQMTLDQPSDLVDYIWRQACALFRQRYDMAVPLRSVGIAISQLCDASSHEQISFFEQDAIKQRKLEIALDQIRARFGYQSINYANLKLHPLLTDFNPKGDHVIFPIGWRR
jgi:DNA polymerase IV